jgi:hypothetical protein
MSSDDHGTTDQSRSGVDDVEQVLDVSPSVIKLYELRSDIVPFVPRMREAVHSPGKTVEHGPFTRYKIRLNDVLS